jgi:hypothetical protein
MRYSHHIVTSVTPVTPRVYVRASGVEPSSRVYLLPLSRGLGSPRTYTPVTLCRTPRERLRGASRLPQTSRQRGAA